MKLLDKFQRRNYWMVINVQATELKVPIIIPIPLFIVEDLLSSLVYLYRTVGRFVPAMRRHVQSVQMSSFHMDLEECLDLPVELIRELRRQGKFTLVEVNDSEAHVSIKLY